MAEQVSAAARASCQIWRSATNSALLCCTLCSFTPHRPSHCPQQARLPDKARRTDLNALSSQHAEVACPQKLCKLTAKNVLRRLFNLEAYSSAGGSVQATVNSYQNVAGVPGSAGLDEDSHRRSSAKGWYTGGQSETAFSDAFPFLVTCQVSHCNPL